ncbi:ATP-binding protein [Archangium violaceum]|uniref:ATP-binding protein n=1 Tax=Archangium violaceum TaxID=83451 RepID=UPI002B2C44B8|nr:ATP-binding protein [Archangium gephyra]
MGGRVAVIIALSTLFSFLHIRQALRTEILEQLQQQVSERAQREQAIFVLAEDDHALIKKTFLEQLQSFQSQQEEVDARFDKLFVRPPDGTVRSRPEVDGSRMVQVFVPRGVVLDAVLRVRILAAYDVLTRFSPVFHLRFKTTYITFPEGVVVAFMPTTPTWSQEIGADFSATQLEDFILSQPEKNPRRQTIWSGVFKEELSKQWMVSVVTPVDLEGRHAVTIGHDLFLEELMARTLNEHLPSAYNVLVRDDGQLIAHPQLKLENATVAYNILSDSGRPDVARKVLGSQENADHVRSLFERLRNRESAQAVLELPEYNEYIAVTRLGGPGWNLATVLPERVVSQPAFFAARYVLLLGILSLLVELVIMFRVLQQQITRPLLALTQATDKVAAGDFKVSLDTSRGDELGQLASAFRLMADEVQRREEALRQANEGLEQRVEERTREVKEVHQQLVQTARRAGMAEIATNVLHNVGNVLNSVYTSSQVAKERVGRMRLEHVGRVAHLLEQHRGDLTSFLTQDERGRHLLPFLNGLGQSLLEERIEVLEMLDDVGRYTEHIGDIVKLQQNYARTPRVREPVELVALVEDSLRINSAGLTRHQVKVQRQLASLPPVMTDKHKMLMILVNLVSNAKYALDHVSSGERLLTVQLEQCAADRVRISIHDNGVGIAPEMLTRIFQYGFTTRVDGHGFGLHSSALAAQEMGGTLSVHSEGLGHGATFSLELPYTPAPPPSPSP